ncbi:MAG: hypothetical protein QG654_196, partial [Patescibacteria group bacterium]|nr:hypothetical protein [Patescibacteria group bacterium]
EKFFGGKKKVEGVNSYKNSVEGVAHVDGSFEENRFDSVKDADSLQDNFKDNKVSERSLSASKRIVEDYGVGKYGADQASLRDDQKTRTKYENDQKPIRKDKNKDWKEKEPFALDLPEEDAEESHLNANAEINHGFEDGEHEEEDDFDLEKAA